MTTSGIITVGYDRTLPICLYDTCVTYISSLYGSLLFYSIEIYIVEYDIYHCLLHMIYVLGLAIYSKLCRGVYAVMLFTPLHIVVINVHDPDLILIVYMLSVTGRLATLK